MVEQRHLSPLFGGNIMIWNLFIHIIAGAIGYRIFSFKSPGLIYCLGMTIVLQGLDMIRFHSNTKKRVFRTPPHIREKQLENLKGSVYFYKLAQVYVAKVVFYGLVTLLASSIMRKIVA